MSSVAGSIHMSWFSVCNKSVIHHLWLFWSYIVPECPEFTRLLPQPFCNWSETFWIFYCICRWSSSRLIWKMKAKLGKPVMAECGKI